MRIAAPLAECSSTPGVDTRSNGRERNRYAALVSAPTGQIWMVLPEKYDWNGLSCATPICCSAPRSSRSMNGSPAICSEKRVQRWHSTQRSRSSSTCVEIGSGLGKVRFTSTNRESVRPVLIAWFCRGHSPPLSQMGQSRGWLMSSSSMTPSCAFFATGEECWVLTTMPSATVMVQLACGLGIGRPPISTSTRHWRQAPAGSSRGWSQKRGTMIPSRSQARISSSPLGASTSRPSIVSRTWPSGTGLVSGFCSGAMVMRRLRSVRPAGPGARPRAARCTGPGTPGGST